MNSASATCPSALSFIFKPYYHSDPVKAGSIGVGCTIDRMVKVAIQPFSHSAILMNGSLITFPTVEYIIHQLIHQPVKVSITSSLPLGFGFGISGASALATAYAVNTLFKLNKPQEDLHRLVHTAEIINKTGLGTVATQITGGFLVKKAPGLPVIAQRLPFEGQTLYLTILDTMETPDILSDPALMDTVSKAADGALERICQSSHPSLNHVLDISYDYIQASGLPMNKQTQHVIEVIRTNGGSATMAILGQTVISTHPPEFSHSYRIEKVKIINTAVRTG